MKLSCSIILLLVAAMAYGQEVKSFTLKNVRDGKAISLADFNANKAVLIIFTGQECPFDNYYKERIKSLVQAYSRNVQFLLINANAEPSESEEQMAIHYTDLPVPYLADKDQLVLAQFGAKKTPEVFLLTPNNGKFFITYSGAIDDNAQSAADVRQSFLKDAIEKTLAGKPVDIATQRASGCTIRKK
jgi:peroxiredoxin